MDGITVHATQSDVRKELQDSMESLGKHWFFAQEFMATRLIVSVTHVASDRVSQCLKLFGDTAAMQRQSAEPDNYLVWLLYVVMHWQNPGVSEGRHAFLKEVVSSGLDSDEALSYIENMDQGVCMDLVLELQELEEQELLLSRFKYEYHGVGKIPFSCVMLRNTKRWHLVRTGLLVNGFMDMRFNENAVRDYLWSAVRVFQTAVEDPDCSAAFGLSLGWDDVELNKRNPFEVAVLLRAYVHPSTPLLVLAGILYETKTEFIENRDRFEQLINIAIDQAHPRHYDAAMAAEDDSDGDSDSDSDSGSDSDMFNDAGNGGDVSDEEDGDAGDNGDDSKDGAAPRRIRASGGEEDTDDTDDADEQEEEEDGEEDGTPLPTPRTFASMSGEEEDEESDDANLSETAAVARDDVESLMGLLRRGMLRETLGTRHTNMLIRIGYRLAISNSRTARPVGQHDG